MPRPAATPVTLSLPEARRLWLRAQRLDALAPFGDGPEATRAAVEHLGYVQIDTINVIERSHHHILWSRIPEYRRADLHRAQSVDKSVFEYWTHALAYVPTRDYRFFAGEMRRRREDPPTWFGAVTPAEMRRLVGRIRREGPLTIRDIDDDVLVEKTHLWASRKPSKRALQVAFYAGLLTISAREGMVKTYEFAERHFGWPPRPRAATEGQVLDYLLDRALRAQGVIGLDSVPELGAARKRAWRELIEARVRARKLAPVAIEGMERLPHWMAAAAEPPAPPAADLVHVLSPFDPLVINRRRLARFFGYQHLFEAYVPRDKRRLGYFALPVLVGERVVAAIDIKADRQGERLLIQNWTWAGDGGPADKPRIEEALGRFERFQFER
jgi:uncharacterized protein YcaQ